jgi:hypothetical protein
MTLSTNRPERANRRDRSQAPSPALLAFCNAVPNVFWSVLCFIPVSVFCYQVMARAWMYGFLAVSLLAAAMPASSLRYFELSSDPSIYRRLGLKWVNRFVQNGSVINGILRRRYPNFRTIRTRATMKEIMASTYRAERFHLAMLFFFLLSALYAVAVRHVGWAALITLTNVVYNLYPIGLQQYVRARMKLSRPV